MAGSSILYGGVAVVGLVLIGSQLSVVPPAPPAVAPVALPATPAAAAAAAPAPVVTPFGEVSLARAPDSHFYAEASVNGAAIHFLVDTGASTVVLTREDARRAGIGTGDYTARGVGAGGEIKLMPVAVTRLALGPVAADNVPAMVAEEGKLPISLLGQSFLSRAASVTIEGDKMVLR